MRRLHVAVVSLIVIASVRFVGLTSGGAQDATPPGASRMAAVLATVPQPGTGFDLWLMRFELAPGESTGAIENDQTRIVEVVRGEIRFRLEQGDVWVFRGGDTSQATQITAGGEGTPLHVGDRLSLSPITHYAYENTGSDPAEVSISALVPSGAAPEADMAVAVPATPVSQPQGLRVLGGATPAAGGPSGCAGGCSHP